MGQTLLPNGGNHALLHLLSVLACVDWLMYHTFVGKKVTTGQCLVSWAAKNVQESLFCREAEGAGVFIPIDKIIAVI